MKTNFLATLSIAVGALILVASSSFYFYKNSFALSNNAAHYYLSQNSHSTVRIAVPNAGIDVPVKSAPNYQFSDNEAIFIESSQEIGTGNSVIYAHNWDRLFGKLKKAKVGNEVKVFLGDGKQVNYKITQIHTVSAKTVGILKATSDSRLTLFTCTGFLDRDRLIIVASQIT